MRSMEEIQLDGKILHGKQLSLDTDEEDISLSHAKVHVFSDFVFCLGKINENPQSNTVWEGRIEVVQKFTRKCWNLNPIYRNSVLDPALAHSMMEYCPKLFMQ